MEEIYNAAEAWYTERKRGGSPRKEAAMNSVSKTMYIPLYGKAYVSSRGMILRDPKAEEIWAAEQFPLRGKARSRWLAYYMAMRAAAIDRWVMARTEEDPEAVVLHIGCGMDSRALRLQKTENLWYDLDFPEVIRERKRYYRETERYRMLCGDVTEGQCLAEIPGERAIVVMEGVSMYLAPERLVEALRGLQGRFQQVLLIMDCYTELAAKMSRLRNPVRDVGVSRVYGMDDPEFLREAGLSLTEELEITPRCFQEQLKPGEQWLFRNLYAGAASRQLYRLYSWKSAAE